MTDELNQTQITDSEITVESTETEKPVEEAKITLTEVEFNKKLQSERSKGKNELLKEFGVTSVNEYNALRAQYDEPIKGREELEKSFKASEDNYKQQINELSQRLTLSQQNVNDDYREDVITLANSKVSETVSFDDAVREILDKNPNWRKVPETAIKIGIPKTEIAPEETVPENMKKRYPWLH